MTCKAVTPENLGEVQFRANVENDKGDPLGMMFNDGWAAEVAWYEWIGSLLERLFRGRRR